jgi:NAD(P)-dependent dehydrogenase (short-subunit alcohol dehydrogenase family)
MTDTASEDPRSAEHTEGFPDQDQNQPGRTSETTPEPDHGEHSYRGSGKLKGRRALITGGDSGIGRAVAIAFAREGADVAITNLPEERKDADETLRWIRDAGVKSLSLEGDLQQEQFCTDIVDRTIAEFGGLDLVVLNAAYQKDRDSLASLKTSELDRVVHTNLYAPIFTARAAIPHLEAGASIIVTASIQAFNPSPSLIDYAMTKAALVAFVKALAQELGPKGIRVNAVAPGPIWTPLIPATGWDAERLASFGQDTPLGRAGQPAELAGTYVYLAGDDASYVSGAVEAVTGGKGL